MFRGLFRSCAKDQRGAVGPAYAVGILALVAVSGVGFDYGRMASLDSELQNGADQAALAGATQLDGEAGACARAADAVTSYVQNHTRVATDGAAPLVTFVAATDCAGATDGASGSFIKFWKDKRKRVGQDEAGTDEEAKFIEVSVDARQVNYALTPLVGAVSSGLMQAAAMAGIGSSICKVPPLMICSPNPSAPFDAAGKRGWGVQVTGHGNNQKTGPEPGPVQHWAPGAFGFLEVGSGQKSELVKALAFTETTLDCAPIDGTRPSTGNPQALYDAINTRFDIYDFNGPNSSTLAPCLSGSCPAALNVVKDLVKENNVVGSKECKLDKKGWRLPDANRQFYPKSTSSDADGDGLGNYNNTAFSTSIDAMGLPRDLCHYASFVLAGGAPCGGGASGRFGDGNWARGDYFSKNHPGGARPSGAGSITRYETYLWELSQNNMRYDTTGSTRQIGRPLCSTGTANGIDRRVLTVAVVKNCAELSGQSTAVKVDEWVDMFLVEPVVDGRENGSVKDSIYMEVIRPSALGQGGGAPQPQKIRRDVPYLVQ